MQQHGRVLCGGDRALRGLQGRGLQGSQAPRGWPSDSPWQRRVYSGRLLRAVCTTSKSRLPRQYMNVGRKSAAMLEEACTRWAPPAGQDGPGGPPKAAHAGSPGVVLDGAQGQAEGQASAGLLLGAHEPLQVGLRGGVGPGV